MPFQHKMNATYDNTTAAATVNSRQKSNPAAVMENASQVNLIGVEDEKDPLALDSSLEQNSLQEHQPQQLAVGAKHSHSLRRHIPRIIVKPIPPEKKTASTVTLTASSATTTIITTSATTIQAANAVASSTTATTNLSPSSRGGSSRRIQQQQQAKAAAAAAAAITSTNSMTATASTAATAITQASTMREVLASIPGFSVKPRRRSSKKISTAAQIEQTKDGKIDLETPDSILASTNLRALLNKQTFSMLPPLYQYNLIQLLPSVDREAIEMEQKLPTAMPMEAIRLGPSSLNNEFFARACLEWRERLAEGEFTPENQMKLKTEAEREKNKLDPWKLKHFEPIWGEKSANRASSSNLYKNNAKPSETGSSSHFTSTTTNAIMSTSNSSTDSTDSCTNLNDHQLEFKMETKGDLTATIVKTTKATSSSTTKTTSAKSTSNALNSAAAVKDDKQSIVEELNAELDAPSLQEEQAEPQQYQQHRIQSSTALICDKQTDKFDMQQPITSDASSAFDMLRMQGISEAMEMPQKRGIKRPSSSPSRLDVKSGNSIMHMESETDASGEDKIERKQIKVEYTDENVAANVYNYDDPSATLPQLQTTNIEELEKPIINAPDCKTVDDAVTNQFVIASKIITPDVKEEVLDKMHVADTANTTHMEYFGQSRNCLNTTHQINYNNNSTCDNVSTLLSSNSFSSSSSPSSSILLLNANTTEPTLQPQLQQQQSQPHNLELQLQLEACTSASIAHDDEDEPIEQKFADAENYVLESGEVSTESTDVINAQNTEATRTVTTNKTVLNQSEFLFSNSLDHGEIICSI